MSLKMHTRVLNIILVILLALALTGCQNTTAVEKEKDTNTAFGEFTNELFISDISANTLNLHYTLSNPGEYGIEEYPITLGNISKSVLQESFTSMKECLDTLTGFSYDDLSDDNKLTYDILLAYLETELSSEDYLLYFSYLGPTTGTQAQLPILLAEYKFNTETDIQDYLGLLETIDTYYRSIMDYEQEKSDAGLFMSDVIADKIIQQCQAFIDTPEDNYLIDTFDNKIDEFSGLTEEQKKEYKTKNLDLLYSNVIPAYQILINGLNSLKGTGTNDAGLCNYENGTAYYEYLVKSSTGSSDSIDEIQKRLNTQLTKDIKEIQEIAASNPNALYSMETVDIEAMEPVDILEELKVKMADDYPTPPDTTYSVNYVHESLEEYLSPAFYLTPPIDDMSNNSIYINNGSSYGNIQLYTVLAHEGYPGHLYQTTYSNTANPNDVRSLLNFKGYVEGWATYVELYSFDYLDLDEDMAKLYKINQSLTLNLYCMVDIGVHYNGWDLQDTTNYLASMGVVDDSIASEIFYAIIESPANYLTYYFGCLNFEDLRAKAEEALGDAFDLQDFHKLILEIGAAPFSVIDKYLDIYIEEELSADTDSSSFTSWILFYKPKESNISASYAGWKVDLFIIVQKIIFQIR